MTWNFLRLTITIFSFVCIVIDGTLLAQPTPHPHPQIKPLSESIGLLPRTLLHSKKLFDSIHHWEIWDSLWLRFWYILFKSIPILNHTASNDKVSLLTLAKINNTNYIYFMIHSKCSEFYSNSSCRSDNILEERHRSPSFDEVKKSQFNRVKIGPVALRHYQFISFSKICKQF